MLVEEFASKLKKMCPSRSELELAGWPEDVINETLSDYYLPLRDSNLAVTVLDDFLNNFFSKYDSSKLEIGMVRFSGDFECFETITIIGKCEADNLVFDNQTHEIFVEEYGVDHVLWKCSKNPEMFFRALLHFEEHATKCLLDDEFFDDEKVASVYATECAEIAGGDEYLPFYQMLLGI